MWVGQRHQELSRMVMGVQRECQGVRGRLQTSRILVRIRGVGGAKAAGEMDAHLVSILAEKLAAKNKLI